MRSPKHPTVSKGEQTREHIVRRAAAVFNERGYAGTSVSDLESATGLKTGGLYRHFPGGKEALAAEAFEYAVGCLDTRFDAAVLAAGDAVARLGALVDVYRGLITDAPLPGGCPVANIALEHDTAGVPALRRRARHAMGRWRSRARAVVEEGRRRGEVRADVDPDAVADTLIAAMEGAVLLAQLAGDAAPLERTAAQMRAYFEAQVRSV